MPDQLEAYMKGADVHTRPEFLARAATAARGVSGSRRVAFRGMTWLEFKDGRIVRGWDSWNLGGLLQSLGAPGA